MQQPGHRSTHKALPSVGSSPSPRAAPEHGGVTLEEGAGSSSSSLLHLLLNHPFPPAQPCSGCPWDVALLSFTNKGFWCQGSPTASQRHRELREEQPTRHCRNGGSCPSAPFMALLEMWEREPGGERKAELEPWAVSPVQRQPPALMPGEKEQGSIREPEQSVQ